jgi:hypothetical protein
MAFDIQGNLTNLQAFHLIRNTLCGAAQDRW